MVSLAEAAAAKKLPAAAWQPAWRTRSSFTCVIPYRRTARGDACPVPKSSIAIAHPRSRLPASFVDERATLVIGVHARDATAQTDSPLRSAG